MATKKLTALDHIRETSQTLDHIIGLLVHAEEYAVFPNTETKERFSKLVDELCSISEDVDLAIVNYKK